MFILVIVFCLVGELKETSDTLMAAALKPNTKRTYSSAQNKFLNFCLSYNLVSMPATEDTLLLYVAFLFDSNLKGSSIRVYLAAARSLHVFSGFDYPVDMLRLKLAVKGAVTQSPPPVRKLPITFPLLSQILQVLSGRFDYKLIRAAMTMAFFGCFRSGELFVVNSKIPFDVQSNLCLGDVIVDYKQKMLSVLLKKSRTDVFSSGVSVFIGCSGHKICAFCVAVDYLQSFAVQGSKIVELS